MSLLSRALARFAPINVGDGTLTALITAIMRPGEFFETLSQQTDAHGPWAIIFDPYEAPASILSWLQQIPGIRRVPADTEAQQRARIAAAAGYYRCTPRAAVEELQLVLAGTKTVLIGLHVPDEWHYMIGTLATETPDAAAVERAVVAQKPVGMIVEIVTTATWTWFVLAPTLIGTRTTVDGVDTYAIGIPAYPTWQDVIDHFTTWTDVINDTPH